MPAAESRRANLTGTVSALAHDLAQAVRHPYSDNSATLQDGFVQQEPQAVAALERSQRLQSETQQHHTVYRADLNGRKALQDSGGHACAVQQSMGAVPQAVRIEADRVAAKLRGTDVDSQVMLRFDFMTSKDTRVSNNNTTLGFDRAAVTFHVQCLLQAATFATAAATVLGLAILVTEVTIKLTVFLCCA